MTSFFITTRANSKKPAGFKRRALQKNDYIKYLTAKLIRLAAGSVQVKRLANGNTLGLVARAGE